MAALAENLRALVEINVDQIAVPSSGGGGEGRIGFGVVRFADQRFYSVKLGNLARDRLGAAGLAGAMMTSGTGIAAMIAAGAVTGWVGGAALVAIGLALIGRGKPFVATFGLDEATALSMAWALSSVEHGFRLVTFDMLVAHLKAVEATYSNAGFTEAKLTNALNRLKALGMIADAGAGRYQLVDRIRMTDAGELRLTGD
ncbi:hypothetical protein ASG37_15700 [Sphingomonas sp. Leaf407]|nr:hypothetical protein ASE97_14955 [Sphingomonas sp. Leaf42]KQT25318.1 hypothetical protein ASG37_15700 [Sphingomonas sp. Leaf407]